jgi:hypothetical protein
MPMMRALFLLGLSIQVHATSVMETNNLRDTALQQLHVFNPGVALPTYHDNPPEASIILPEGDNQTLKQLGKMRAKEDTTANFVLKEEHSREKSNSEDYSKEFIEAEALLDQPELVNDLNSLDPTQFQESDDINEGLSHLGVLGATAEEVSNLQVNSGTPRLFAGVDQECEKYPLGLRDCCTDSGLLDGLIHCPWQLQQLQKAKNENRAVYLGHYKPHRFSTTRYRYCVFPNKLAGIIQIQGRLGQLGIGFGSVWHPDCRGMTPEELARLDFKRLDINQLVEELTHKKTLPSNTSLDNQSVNHVEKLYQQGVSHD